MRDAWSAAVGGCALLLLTLGSAQAQSAPAVAEPRQTFDTARNGNFHAPAWPATSAVRTAIPGWHSVRGEPRWDDGVVVCGRADVLAQTWWCPDPRWVGDFDFHLRARVRGAYSLTLVHDEVHALIAPVAAGTMGGR